MNVINMYSGDRAVAELPRGIKSDQSDQEILGHLLAKAVCENLKPHPFRKQRFKNLIKSEFIGML